MAKQLYPACETVRVKKILLAWDTDEEGNTTQYAVVMGQSLDSDGDPIPGQDVHEKITLPGVEWDETNLKNEAKKLVDEACKMVEKAFKDKADLNVKL